ncbi:hypothetical protein ACFE04_021959 [Oxalis oulophora]
MYLLFLPNLCLSKDYTICATNQDINLHLERAGLISHATLSHPGASGGITTYEGRFESVGLSGYFIPTERGEKNGGLNVILLSSKVMLGEGVTGPLKASRPVKILIGSLLLDPIVADGTSGSGANGQIGAETLNLVRNSKSPRKNVEASRNVNVIVKIN